MQWQMPKFIFLQVSPKEKGFVLLDIPWKWDENMAESPTVWVTYIIIIIAIM